MCFEPRNLGLRQRLVLQARRLQSLVPVGPGRGRKCCWSAFGRTRRPLHATIFRAESEAAFRSLMRLRRGLWPVGHKAGKCGLLVSCVVGRFERVLQVPG